MTIGFVLSLLLTRICINVLPKLKMVDVPRGRHQHDHTVPRGGGIAIILSFVTVAVLYLFVGGKFDGRWTSIPILSQMGVPILMITALGICDDRFGLGSHVKLLVQIFVALFFYFTGAAITTFLGFHLPAYLSLPLTVCWVVGIINAFNLIDGMDGVAAGLAAITAFSMASWQFISGESILSTVCLLAFCGCCLGFLRYNFFPARIFMGDTGSMFIGMFFAYFSMAESSKAVTLTSFLVPLLTMGIPIFDVFLAILRRSFRKYVKKEPGISIMSGDHDHLHHRIQDETRNQRKTACYLYFMAVILVIGAFAAALLQNKLHSVSFAILLGIFFIVIRSATVESYDVATLISIGIRIPNRSFILTAAHPLVDLLLVIVAYYMASKLFSCERTFFSDPYKQFFCLVAPYPVFLIASKIYRTYWLRAGFVRYYRLFLTLLIASGVTFLLAFFLSQAELGENFSRLVLFQKFFIVYALLVVNMIFLERFFLHYMESYRLKKMAVAFADNKQKLPRTVIYGGGLCCRMFLTSQYCQNLTQPTRNIIGLIDDNLSLQGLNVYGLEVLGTSRELETLHRKYLFDEIMITLDPLPEESQISLKNFSAEKRVRIVRFRYSLEDLNTIFDNESILNPKTRNA